MVGHWIAVATAAGTNVRRAPPHETRQGTAGSRWASRTRHGLIVTSHARCSVYATRALGYRVAGNEQRVREPPELSAERSFAAMRTWVRTRTVVRDL